MEAELSVTLQQSESLQQDAVFSSVRKRRICLCPTLDLIAIVDGDVKVYRFNGQLAFGKKRPVAEVEAQGICWKFDGKYLAIAWSNGCVEMLSTETGKVLLNGAIQTIQTSANVPDQPQSENSDTPKPRNVSCLGWDVTFIDPTRVKAKIALQTQHAGLSTAESSTDDWDTQLVSVTLDDFLERIPNEQRLAVDPHLLDCLATFDVDTVFPKLGVPPAVAPKPAHSQAATNHDHKTIEIFSSQPSLDAIFHSKLTEDLNTVSTLIICSTDGTIQPFIHDAMNIGVCRLPYVEHSFFYRACLIASHPFTHTDMLLVEASLPPQELLHLPYGETRYQKLALVPVTLGSIRLAGTAMQLIATKVIQLQNLYYYINTVGKICRDLYQETRAIPNIKMQLLDEESASKELGLSSSELLHRLAATGHCGEVLHEWLVDAVSERGHKRWEIEVDSAYSKLIDAFHENLLPAIDRSTTVAGALRGLATYHDYDDRFNVNPERFTRILDVLSSMRMILRECLEYAVDERQQFLAFSKWLRLQIDVQASSSSDDSDEFSEQQAAIDVYKVLIYIEGGLLKTKLAFFWQPYGEKHEDIIGNGDFAPWDVDNNHEQVAEALENIRGKNEEVVEAELPFMFFCARLTRAIEQTRNEFGEWQQRKVRMPGGLVLENGELPSVLDARMVFEQPTEAQHFATYVALIPGKSQHEVRIHRIKHANQVYSMERGVQMPESMTAILPESEIKHLKFFDDNFLILILSVEDTSYLLAMPYRKLIFSAISDLNRQRTETESESTEEIQDLLLPDGHARRSTTEIDLRELSQIRPYILHAFPHSERFKPETLAINNRKNRRVICVFGEDRRTFRIFDVEAKGTNEATTVQVGDDDADTPMDG